MDAWQREVQLLFVCAASQLNATAVGSTSRIAGVVGTLMHRVTAVKRVSVLTRPVQLLIALAA